MHPVKMVFSTDESVLLVCWMLDKAGKVGEFKVEAGGAEVRAWSVEFDQYGLSIQEVRDLPEGSYTATLDNMTTTFMVAQHKLAALNAEFVERPSFLGKTMKCTVGLTSYGQFCRGRVTVELMQGETRVDSKRPMVRCGLASVNFKLPEGEETLTLNFVSGSKTASLPLRGAKESERKLDLVSDLGQKFTASLMPPGDDCRGVFLHSGAANNEPFFVEELVCESGIGQIKLREKVDVLLVQVVNLITGDMVCINRRDLPKGDSQFVSFSDACVVYLAAFVDGKPYEARTMFLQPETLDVRVEGEEEVEPGSEVELTITTGAHFAVPAVVTVTDSRLVMPTTLRTEAASRLKRGIAGLPQIKTGEPKNDEAALSRFHMSVAGFDFSRVLSAGAPPAGSYEGGMRRSHSLHSPGFGLTRRAIVSKELGLDELQSTPMDLGSELYRDGADVDVPIGAAVDEIAFDSLAAECTRETAVAEKPAREKFPQVVYCGVVVIDGSETIKFTAPDTITNLTVCVQAIHGTGVVLHEQKVEVTKAVWAELDVPPFVTPGDNVTGQVHVGCRAGSFTAQLFRDGMPVELYLGDEEVSGEDVDSESATLTFQVEPGIYEVRAQGEDGEDSCIRVVSEPGNIRYIARTLTFLRPGDSFEMEPGVQSIQLLPGVERQLDLVTKVAAFCGYDCCEQTATKVRAACLMWLGAGGDSERRRRAESIILAGIRREESMYTDHGFKMYPSSGINDHYSHLAAEYLYASLKSLQGAKGMSLALKAACDRGVEMAEKVAKFHSISLCPTKPTNCREAYMAHLGGRREGVASFVLERLKSEGDCLACEGEGAVNRRAETAYAAAILLKEGHLVEGVKAVNWVAAQMQEGAWYSTVDTSAGLAMMAAVASSTLVVSGKSVVEVNVNGESMKLEDALTFSEQITCVEMPEGSKGVLAVQVVRVRERDLTQFESAAKVEVSLGNRKPLKRGQGATLSVRLTEGYQAGDLAMIMLPPALSFVLGGTQVKMAALDFCGQDQLEVPVAVTADEACRQKFAVCVTNMFKEERVGNPGLQEVKVA